MILWPRLKPGNQTQAEPVAVLIPARNEQDRLPGCLERVLNQPGVSEVVVCDDQSEDRTAKVVERLALQDARIRLIRPGPPPEGWCGKPYACQKLAEAASSPWLVFLDADAMLAPRSLPGIIQAAKQHNVALLSCWPGLKMGGVWEKILMPLLNFVVFTLYPAPLALSRKDASLGLAHGALILVRRDVYFKTGGHAAVRSELFEDTALARRWRACGETSLCLDGQDVVTTRMYTGLSEIWAGFQKNFFPAFRTRTGFWGFLALHAAVFLGPFLLLVWPAAVCVWAMRALLAARFKHPLWSVFFHPAAELFLLALGLTSWWRFNHGGGVEWKGRRYKRA